MVAIVALLSVEDIFIRPRSPEAMEAASRAHSRYFDRVRPARLRRRNRACRRLIVYGVGIVCCAPQTGDHMTLVHIWDAFAESGFSPEWARETFLHFRALKMARSIHAQLLELLHKLVRPAADAVAAANDVLR